MQICYIFAIEISITLDFTKKNAKPVVTISRAEGSWQRCHPIVAVMQPRMYIYIRVGHKPFNAEWSKHRNNMKIELTDKQAQVLYYVLDRVNKCLEKDNLFGGTLYHDNGSFLCQLEPVLIVPLWN